MRRCMSRCMKAKNTADTATVVAFNMKTTSSMFVRASQAS